MAHVIVCGLGHVGFRTAMLLRQLGQDVTVVTQDTRQEFIELVEGTGVHIVHGDARADHVLLQAGLLEASALVTCIDDDVTNIEVALDARRLHPGLRVVARVFDQTLARRLESTVGISKVLGMSLLAAPAFAAEAFGDRVFGAVTHEGRPYLATRLSAERASEAHVLFQEPGDEDIEALVPLSDFALTPRPGLPSARRGLVGWLAHAWGAWRQLWNSLSPVLRTVMLLILALAFVSVFVFQVGMRLSPIDAVYFVVTTLTTTGYGDISLKGEPVALKIYGCFLMLLGSASIATLYSLITDFVVTARFDEILGRRSVNMVGHIVVVGLGNVGYRVAEVLTQMGAQVAVVELDPDAPYRRFLAKGVAFTSGDGRDTQTLDRAGVRSARAVIVATQNDAVNLSVGLSARTLNSDARIVVRLFDAEFARKVEEVTVVDAALSASRIAAPGFAGAALFPDALFCYSHDDRFCVVRGSDGRGLEIEVLRLRTP